MQNLDIIIAALPQLLHGLGLTIVYSLVAIVLGMIIGLIAALCKLSRVKPLRLIASTYVEMFRGTPLLVQVFFIVLGLPAVLPLNEWIGPTHYPYIAAALALALNEGAYITEIVRAGILGVDKGQSEAARSLGMTEMQGLRLIVLPQAFKRMIPPLVNQFAQTIKDTSLLAPVSIIELVYTGQIVISQTFAAFQIWTVVAALYFIVIFTLSLLAKKLERQLNLDQR